MPRKKKPRGRPPVKPMPEPIDATPEEIAEVVLQFNPAGYEWRYTIQDDAADEDSRSR